MSGTIQVRPADPFRKSSCTRMLRSNMDNTSVITGHDVTSRPYVAPENSLTGA